MKRKPMQPKTEKEEEDILPEDTFNGNLTARPRDYDSADQMGTDADLVATTRDYGKMNVHDARDSGYIGKNGKAVSLAKRHR